MIILLLPQAVIFYYKTNEQYKTFAILTNSSFLLQI